MKLTEKSLKVGDRIVVTRTKGHSTFTTEGTVRDINSLGGFRIEGYRSDGSRVNRWLAPADQLVPFGVTQTIVRQ